VVRYGAIQLAFTEGEATLAAEAAECAGEQSEPAYWLYHNRLYDELVSPSRAEYNAENLKRFANELGLDGTAFSQCLDTGRFAADIQEQKQAAYALGVYNTPTFFINGSQIQGDQPFETFKSMIEAAASLLP
jgi:protein-disulfide isomerase